MLTQHDTQIPLSSTGRWPGVSGLWSGSGPGHLGATRSLCSLTRDSEQKGPALPPSRREPQVGRGAACSRPVHRRVGGAGWYGSVGAHDSTRSHELWGDAVCLLAPYAPFPLCLTRVAPFFLSGQWAPVCVSEGAPTVQTGASVRVCWPTPKPGLFIPGRKGGPRVPGQGKSRSRGTPGSPGAGRTKPRPLGEEGSCPKWGHVGEAGPGDSVSPRLARPHATLRPGHSQPSSVGSLFR